MPEKLTISDLTSKEPENYTTNQENIQNILREDIKNKENHFYVETKLPRNEFERKIMDAIKNDNQDFIAISDQKKRIAEFDKKMKRIKKIKSRNFRKHYKMMKKKKEIENEIPDFVLENIENEKKEKVFHDSEMAKKVGKILNIEASCSESSDSECELMKNEKEDEDLHFLDFKKEKKEEIEKNLPKEIEKVLPGWGNWGGTNLETIRTSANTISSKKEGIQKKKRKDFQMSRVIINENNLNNNLKVNLPFGFTKSEYEAWLNIPVSREAYSNRIFQKFLKNNKKIDDRPAESLDYQPKYDKYG